MKFEKRETMVAWKKPSEREKYLNRNVVSAYELGMNFVDWDDRTLLYFNEVGDMFLNFSHLTADELYFFAKEKEKMEKLQRKKDLGIDVLGELKESDEE